MKMALKQVILFLFGFASFVSCSKKPNVIFFLTDDWGFNDVGYHENTFTKTPFIDATAVDDSLIIEKYYAYPLCTITRCALLTGRYPIRYGMQTEVLQYKSNYALSKQETLLAEEFKAQGYSTHAVGKWHLGMMKYDYTPTLRGFDTFFGYYGGALYYYEHIGDDTSFNAYDMRWGVDEYDEPKRYSLYLWAEHTEALIKSLASDEESDPFFMYIAWQGSHTPSEADDAYLDEYVAGLTDAQIESSSDRLVFQAQTTMSDRLFKVVADALKASNQWDNTIIAFASDNGGYAGYGDNSPLRGGKTTVWEGGVRLPSFITGGHLPKHLRGKLFDSYPMHVTDWYKTLLTAAGLEVVVSSKTLDGENLWKLLQTATKVTKDWYRYALTDDSNWDYDHGSVDFANNNNNDNNDLTENEMFASLLSMNKQHRGINDDYIANGGLDAKRDLYDKNLYDGSLDELISITDGRKMLINANSDSCDTDICGALIYAGRWKILYGASQVNSFCDWERTFELTTNDILGCGGIPANVNTSCTCVNSVCLFDLLNDPCEYYDVSSDNIELTQMLYSELEYYYNIQVGPLYNEFGQVDDNVVDPCEGNSSSSCWWKPWSNESSWQDLAFEVWLTHEYSNETSEMDSSSDEDEMDKDDFDSDAATIIAIAMGNNENENENDSGKKRISSKVERIKEMPESAESVHGEKNQNKIIGNGNANNNNNNNKNKEESVNYYDYYIKDSNRNPHFKVFAIGLIVIMAIVFFCIFPFCGDIIRHCDTYINFDWKQFKHEPITTNDSDNNNYMIPSEVSPLVIKVNAQDTQSYTMGLHE